MSYRPRPRRHDARHRFYWPHLHGHLALTMPRSQIGRPLFIIDLDERMPLPPATPEFGPQWPIIRARIIARLRAHYPGHPWLNGEAPAEGTMNDER